MYELNFRARYGKKIAKHQLDRMKQASQKGLFTFYREQEQLQQRRKQDKSQQQKITLTEQSIVLPQQQKREQTQKKIKSKDSTKKQQQIKIITRYLSNVSINNKQYHQEQNCSSEDQLIRKFLFHVKERRETKSSIQTSINKKRVQTQLNHFQQDQLTRLQQRAKIHSKLQNYELKKSCKIRQFALDDKLLKLNPNINEQKIKSIRFHQKKFIRQRNRIINQYNRCVSQNSNNNICKIITTKMIKIVPQNQTQTIELQPKKKIFNVALTNKTEKKACVELQTMINDQNQKNKFILQEKQQSSIKFPFIKNRNILQSKKDLKKFSQNNIHFHKQNFTKCIKLFKKHREQLQAEGRERERKSKSIQISKNKLFTYSQKLIQPKECISKAMTDINNKIDLHQLLSNKYPKINKKKILKKNIKQKY